MRFLFWQLANHFDPSSVRQLVIEAINVIHNTKMLSGIVYLEIVLAIKKSSISIAHSVGECEIGGSAHSIHIHTGPFPCIMRVRRSNKEPRVNTEEEKKCKIKCNRKLNRENGNGNHAIH